MSSGADKVFDLVASKLRKKKGLCPPTPEEAADAFKKAKAIPLTKEEHDAIVEAMLSEESRASVLERAEPLRSAPVDQEIDAESHSMCRKPGDSDQETDRLESQMEQELFEDDNDEV